MNAQLAVNNAPKPRLSALLSQVATIATVKTSSLGLTRLDKDASAASDRNHNAKHGTSKVGVSRLSGAEDRVKEINSKASETREELRAITTAWNDDRLLANTMLQQWLTLWGTRKREYTDLVDRFVADAPQLIAAAERNLGSYAVEPPTEEEIRNAFSMEFEMTQIPDSSTYQTSGLAKDMEAELRRRFEASIEAAYQNATTDALQRVAKPLAHMVERLTVYSKTEDAKANDESVKSARLYDSVVTNVQDIAKVFGSFNLTGDPLMDKVAQALTEFDHLDAEALKKSDAMRGHVTKKAEEILADLADLI
jgi:hypothetical protein